jgi:hypothetical protein
VKQEPNCIKDRQICTARAGKNEAGMLSYQENQFPRRISRLWSLHQQYGCEQDKRLGIVGDNSDSSLALIPLYNTHDQMRDFLEAYAKKEAAGRLHSYSDREFACVAPCNYRCQNCLSCNFLLRTLLRLQSLGVRVVGADYLEISHHTPSTAITL